MGARQAFRDLEAPVRDLVGWKWFATKELVERMALHVLHDDKVEVPLAPEFVDLNDVAVSHRGREPSLIEKHAPSLRVECDVGGEHLDGDGAVEHRVFGPLHHAHPALADLLDEPVVG